jgi:hypothetical protein
MAWINSTRIPQLGDRQDSAGEHEVRPGEDEGTLAHRVKDHVIALHLGREVPCAIIIILGNVTEPPLALAQGTLASRRSLHQ